MPTTSQAGGAAAAIAGAYTATALTDWPNQRSVEVLTFCLFAAFGLVFLLLGAQLARSTHGRLRAAWIAMTISLVNWAASEAIWAYNGLLGVVTPIPSWADTTYVLFVAGMAAALLLFPTAWSTRGQGRTLLDGFILTGSFFLIAWLSVLRSIWERGVPGEPKFAVLLAYPAGDFLVLAIAFLVLLRVIRGLRMTLTLLVAALAGNVLADSVWAYLSNTSRYAPGSLSDVLAVGAAVLVVVALVAAHSAESGGAAQEGPAGRLALWLPLMPVVVALLFVAPAQQHIIVEPPVVITGVLLIAATVIRQVLEASDAVRRENQIRVLADRLAADLNSAARYVASILPGELPGPVEVTSRYLPSRAVGGDSFGYTWLPDDGTDHGHLIVYLIDVSGHGVEPALLSVSVHNLLRSGSLPESTLLEPDRVLTELNGLFSMDSHDGHYFTMWYGVYHRSTGVLRYASAGHPPALALNADSDRGTVTPLDGGGSMPVGMFDECEFAVKNYPVPAGSRILLYSDGVLGEPPQPAQFVALCSQWASQRTSESSPSLDSLISALPDTVAEDDPDDRSLVLLSFSG